MPAEALIKKTSLDVEKILAKKRENAHPEFINFLIDQNIIDGEFLYADRLVRNVKYVKNDDENTFEETEFPNPDYYVGLGYDTQE